MITNTLFQNILESTFYNIDKDILYAIAQVESDGNGWEDDRIKIRFETHVFLNMCPDAINHFRLYEPNWDNHYYYFDNEWKYVHESQSNERQALDIAKQFCFQNAYNSISVGTYQINTINYKNIGFPSGFLMYAYMGESPEREIEVLHKMINKNKRLEQAMIDKNLETIAYYWNPYNNIWKEEFIKEYNKIKGL